MANPMQKKSRRSFILGILVAVILMGIVVAFLLVQISKLKQEEEERIASQVKIYALNQDVKSGQLITPNMLDQIQIDKGVIPSNAVQNVDQYFLVDQDGNTVETVIDETTEEPVTCVNIDGKQYGVPFCFDTIGVWYNKEIFDEAGVPYPEDDWTWEDVEKASKQIQSKLDDVNGFTLPIGTLPYTLEMYLWSNGTAFVDEDGKLDGNINSDKSVEVFQMFQDMEKDGVLYASEESGQTEMLGGKTAMYVDGTWPIKQFEEEGLNYGIAQIPKFEGTEHSVSVINTSGIAISKDSKHKDEAWEFLKYWTGEEMNVHRIETELPALKSVVESENLREDPNCAPFYTALDNCAGHTPASFIAEGWTEIDSDVQLAFESIINPSSLADPKKALDEVVASHE